jgi:hypothetical protein
MTEAAREHVSRGRRFARWLWRVLRWFCRFWLIVLVLLAILWTVFTARTGRELEAELNAIRERGEPLTSAEIAPEVPQGEKNAAQIYQTAFDFLTLGDFDVEHGQADVDFGREVIDQQSTSIRLLIEAGETPYCAWPIDYNAPAYSLVFPHFAQMRSAARLLSMDSYVLAAEGDHDEALRSSGAIFGIAEHAKTEPTLIGVLVGYAMQGIGAMALEESLSLGDPSPAACRRLFDQLNSVDQRTSMRRALMGERAMGLQLFEDIRARRGESVAAFSDQSGYSPYDGLRRLTFHLYPTLGRPLFNLDEAAFIRHLNANIEAIDLPWPQSRDQARRLDYEHPARHVLTSMITPVFSRASWSMERASAKIGAAQIALAAKAYRAEHGTYPEWLSELEADGWELPSDPFSGKPYHYRREGDSFIVWSVGPNMADDNGVPYDGQAGMRRDDGPYDIPFICDPVRAREQAAERAANWEEQERQRAEEEAENQRREGFGYGSPDRRGRPSGAGGIGRADGRLSRRRGAR